jgi:uncharacterized membrane protein
MSGSPASNPSSDTGLASHIASGLAALFPPITGIIFYFIEKKDSLARHWAVQSIFFGCTAFLVSVAINILTVFFSVVHLGGIFLLLGWLWSVVCFVLWVLGLINAFQAKRWEYPIISQQCKKLFPKLVP